jgi:hypothetical protein
VGATMTSGNEACWAHFEQRKRAYVAASLSVGADALDQRGVQRSASARSSP